MQEVSHSGIKGQKWGVRRFQFEDGSLTEEGKERYNKSTGKKPKKQKPESATWKSKDAGSLSDAELNRRNSRLQREAQYRQMTKSKQRKAAEWIAKTAGVILVGTAIGVLKSKMGGAYKGMFESFASAIDVRNINLSNLHIGVKGNK